MPRGVPLLTDRQWAKIEPLLPKLRSGKQGGRPWSDSRRVLEGMLWIARNGARWQDLPAEYPSPATCWRRLRGWKERDVWLTIWRTFLGELNRKGRLDWSEAFIDGSFASAKKGASELERPSGVRGQSGWWWSMARVFLWEYTSDLPRRAKSLSPKPRLLPSVFQPARLRSATTKAAKTDCRQGLRQRSVAYASQETWHRVDRSPQDKQGSEADPRWPKPQTLSQTMEDRTNQRMARQLPPTRRPIGTIPQHLQSLLPYRLLHDRSQ